MEQIIYMGYDPREELTYDLARYSILSRVTQPTRIIPLELGGGRLQKILTRPIERRINDKGHLQLWCPISDAPMSTEFAISRFAVPHLRNRGWALFIDCDMVCLDDISKLFELADSQYAVMVVKHVHIPEEEEKFHDAGQIQTIYHRKNWSSVMLFNCEHPSNKNLTLEVLNTWPGRDLHAFKWLKDEEIGELPQEWNFLVDINEGELDKQKMLHYTNGQPGWGELWESKPSDYIFNQELEKMQKDKDFYSKYTRRTGASIK